MKKVIWNFNFMLNYIGTKETAFDQNLYSYTFFQQANKIYVMFAKAKDHFQWPKLVQVKKKKHQDYIQMSIVSTLFCYLNRFLSTGLRSDG